MVAVVKFWPSVSTGPLSIAQWFFKWSEVPQSCPTLCHPMDCSLQGFSVHGIFQARVFPSPGDLPHPGIEPGSPALQADALPSEPPGKPSKWFLGFPKTLLPFSPTLMWKLLYFLPIFDQTTSLPRIQQTVSPLTMQDLNFLPPNLITYITWSKASCFEDSSTWWKCSMTQKALEDNEGLYWKVLKELTKMKRRTNLRTHS